MTRNNPSDSSESNQKRVISEEVVSTEETLADTQEIIVARGRIPSMFEEALLDFGKSMVKDSVAQSLDFHKTMLGLTATFTTLMASAFGILVIGTSNGQLDLYQRFFLVLPVFFMLLSSICFAQGYYPRRVKLNLQVIDTIENARDKLLRTRMNWALGGILLFSLSILALVIGMILLNL